MRVGELNAAFALFALALAACDGMPCEHIVRSEVMSPDGRFKAAILNVDCGATTQEATWIILSRAEDSYDFRKDRTSVFEGVVRDISWRAGTLAIDYGDAKIFERKSEAMGVAIVYEKADEKK